jgi:hypothetical protein
MSTGRGLERFRPGEIILAGVDRVVAFRWDSARRAADATVGTRSERVAQLKRAFARELGTVGAAAGATATVPVVGTAGAVGTAAAELSWFTLRAGDLILAIAAVHGHTEPSVEERRAWVLSILAFGNSAAATFTKLAGEAGKGLGAKTTARIPTEVLRRMNRLLGRTVVTKYGTRRGAIAVGRALPLGFGAAIGGTANYALIRMIARQADTFFAHLPPTSSADAFSTGS